MHQELQQKKGLVKEVFNKVFDKYDLMNDFISLGIHRRWKKDFIQMLNPTSKKKLIDVGCGTGDIANLYIKLTNNNTRILCIDPNKKMIEEGKKKLIKHKNIIWKVGCAENLKVEDNTYDFYTISFGLRNTKDLNKSLSEAYRVLRKGGRFLCLEFSKIENSNLEFVYKNYSKIIPFIGQLIVGDKKPYEYLINSIEKFVNQEKLLELMKKNNFRNCTYKNLSGGIVSIHSGWKV